jgi:hypothetical protein
MLVRLNQIAGNKSDINTEKLDTVLERSSKSIFAIKKSIGEYDAKVAYCKNITGGNQFNHLSNLAKNVDIKLPKRCGWMYDPHNYKLGRGAFGSKDGADLDKTSGEWMWDLNEAKKRYHIDLCAQGVSRCRGIADSEFNKKCGWCKDSAKAVPIDSFGDLAYPEVRIARCQPKSIVKDASSCTPEGFTGTILPNTPISRNQILSQTINPGDYETGAINYSLQAGSNSIPMHDLSKKRAWEIYGKGSLYPVNESSFLSTRVTVKDALNGFEGKVEKSISGANNTLVFFGRNLSCNKGVNDKYDFTIEEQFNLLR